MSDNDANTTRARAAIQVKDISACLSGPCYLYGINGRGLGACGTSPSFLDDICNATDQASNSNSTFEWFSVNSADSNGASAGLQWATGDPMYRCADSTKECWQDDTLAHSPYTISFRSYFDDSETTCIPADVVGDKICALRLQPVHVGAR